jgi:transmembrane sensor
MDRQKALNLLQKYRTNQCTAEERAIADRWFTHFYESQDVSSLPDDQYDLIEQEIWSKLRPKPAKRKLPVYFRYAAAATIAITVGIFSYQYYNNTYKKDSITQTIATNDIQPGGNNAVLTLANGKKVSLNSVNGALQSISPSGVLINNNAANGIVSFSTRNNPVGMTTLNNADGPNTITTPRGGQYQLILPDGTRVYLNAASTIIFPSRYAGNTRSVSLVGEAYFEVAKNAKQPFLVTTKGQQLKVLGTHFNVSAYPHEQLKTTLAEGSVELTSSLSSLKQLLKPDQQALLLPAGVFEVSNVDAEREMAWKKGYFNFELTPLPEAVTQICRWYDVDAKTEDLPNIPITAFLPNKIPLSELIQGLEAMNGITIKITAERRLIITKKQK